MAVPNLWKTATLKGYIIFFSLMILGAIIIYSIGEFSLNNKNEQIINGKVIELHQRYRGIEGLDILNNSGVTTSYTFPYYNRNILETISIGDSVITSVDDTTIRIFRDGKIFLTLKKKKFFRIK